jgi:hypothetical protein
MTALEQYEHRAPHIENSQPFDAQALLSQAPQPEINVAPSTGAAEFLQQCSLTISGAGDTQAPQTAGLAGLVGESAGLGPAYSQTSGTASSAIADWLGQNPRVTQAISGMIRDIPFNPMMAGTDALIGLGTGLAADYVSQHSDALTRPWRNIGSGQGTGTDYAIAGGEIVAGAGLLFLASRAPSALRAFNHSLAGEILRDTPWIARTLSQMAILRVLPERTAQRLANHWYPPR